jgi:hypothetical protein
MRDARQADSFMGTAHSTYSYIIHARSLVTPYYTGSYLLILLPTALVARARHTNTYLTGAPLELGSLAKVRVSPSLTRAFALL